MNRIDKLFGDKGRKILSVYFTAGYPEIDSTIPILKSLQSSGVDMVEIGIPFSDPVADGPVIQESSSVALKNGMRLEKLFSQLENFRAEINIPVVLMGYINPILNYGFEEFADKCKETGIDGVIIPDLPYDESKIVSPGLLNERGIHFIQLVTPMTENERLRDISEISNGFIYVVSSYSTTGGRVLAEDNPEYFSRLKQYTDKPLLVGFGISDSTTYNSACRVSDGVIIGSAFIRALEKGSDIKNTTRDFISGIR